MIKIKTQNVILTCGSDRSVRSQNLHFHSDAGPCTPPTDVMVGPHHNSAQGGRHNLGIRICSIAAQALTL